MNGDRCAVMFQGIKNGDAIKDIATGRIDMKVDMGNVAKRLQVIHKLARRHPQ